MSTRSLASGVAWLRRRLLAPAVPLAAVEVRGASLGCVRLRRARERLVLESAGVLDLPEGCVVTSMEEPNIRDPQVFLATLGSLLDRAGLAAGGPVALVLPDSVLRVRLVPRSELQGSGADVAELLRFRLRSTVPFDIRGAGLAWTTAGADQILAAVIGARVRESYETTCAAVGLEVGLLVPATLALAEVPELQAPGDHLIVNRDDDYVSFLLVRDGQVLLYRSLAAEALGTPERVGREAATTLLYYRERLGGPGITSLRVRACGTAFPELAAALEGPAGLAPEPLSVWDGLAAVGDEARLDAVAAAVACLRGRAA